VAGTYWRDVMRSAVSAIDGTSLDVARRSFARCTLFRGLSAAEKETLLARARVRRFETGETIFLMGSSGNSMMAVLSGDVRISVPSTDGREIVLAILHENEYFGEIAMLDGKERTADARAMTSCTLAILERRDVMALFERNPGAWAGMVEVLCERLRATDQHVAEIALLRLPTRLAKALLRTIKAEDGDRAVGGNAIPLSQRELGALVGAARESVNRCLREWQRSGLVRVDGNSITIINRGTLEELAQQD
jgi:CRP/FNR family transcriptional regulator, cyclic AMP receptor protein